MAVLAVTIIAGVADAGWLKPEVVPAQLRCEYLENPLGIDVARPRLGWKIEEKSASFAKATEAMEVRGLKQTAYQILVASSEELLKKDKGDLWDSGKVDSDESANRVYDGKPLDSASYYAWKVRVWDGAGRASAWSQQARFLTGMRDWQGKWIGATEQTPAGSGVLGFAVEGKAPDEVKWVQVDLGSSISMNGRTMSVPVSSARFTCCWACRNSGRRS